MYNSPTIHYSFIMPKKSKEEIAQVKKKKKPCIRVYSTDDARQWLAGVLMVVVVVVVVGGVYLHWFRRPRFCK